MAMNRNQRRWHHDQDDDPLAGLVNLFDLWIVVVVALILVLANSASSQLRKEQQTASDSQDRPNLVPIPSFRESDSELTGKGTRLGTAYRLENGQIVYAPD